MKHQVDEFQFLSGPVFVEFPVDTLYPYHMVLKEAGVKTDAKGFMPYLVNQYLTFHIRSVNIL